MTRTEAELDGSTQPTIAEVQLHRGIRIGLRDGVHLHALLYLPLSYRSRAPVIVTLTPYIAQNCHEHGVYFAARGYPFLVVDVRGRGDSEGEFHPLNEAHDGYDVVEWAARQWYCNGQVAMWGLSYMGYGQWAAAKELPPHLATIVPVAAPFRGVDSPLRNNVFTPYTIRWLTAVSGRVSNDKIFMDQTFWNRKFQQWFESGAAFKQLDTFFAAPSPLFQEWISHPQQDSYWDSYNPTAEQYARLSMPILTITGIYDADQPGALAHYCEHMKNACAAARAQHYLVIGPWDHAGTRVPKAQFAGITVGPASLVDLSKLHLEWYAWVMQGAPRPQLLKKQVTYYVMGAEEWRYADSLEAVTARSVPFYLRSTINPTDVFRSGSLCAAPPRDSGTDQYVYDPREVGHAQLESKVDPEDRTDQRMIHALNGRQLIYHSVPFDEDVEVSGFFKLKVWLSIDQPDTDFRVAVYEVLTDGCILQLTIDWMRARYRESFREQKLIDTRAPLCYDFERFTFTARRISKGSRLRLVIGPLDSIHWQRNYNSGGTMSEESMRDARPVTVTLYHDETHPSALYVPFGYQTDG